jgi:hypothetical protein
MEKDIWRVVCTQNKEGKTYVDFAIATPQEAKLAHSHMIKLSKTKYSDDSIEAILPPMFIENRKIKFSHPEYETAENNKKLQELTPRILAEFNKFNEFLTRHPDWKSSFDSLDKDVLINTLYKDVDIYNKRPQSPEEDKQLRRIIRSRARDAFKRGNLEEYYKYKHFDNRGD